MAPPIEPGIQERNSRPPNSASLAKFATFRSRVAAPTFKIFLLSSSILEKFELNLITAPLTPLSLISVFEPAPRIVTLNLFFLHSFKNSFNWSLFLGLKRN